jgi:hypothetical protein
MKNDINNLIWVLGVTTVLPSYCACLALEPTSTTLEIKFETNHLYLEINNNYI